MNELPDVVQALHDDITLMIDNNETMAVQIRHRLAKVSRTPDADQWAGEKIHAALLLRAQRDGLRTNTFTYELLTQLLSAGSGAWRWIGGHYLEGD